MSTETPSVSIVVPVFNGQDTIAACLDSLLSLNFPRELFEVVVVNNASTDKTAEVLVGYKASVKLLLETKRGAAAARNRGVREAAGEIVAFTDADCTVHHDWLRHLIEPLKDKSIGIVGGRILSVRPCNSIEKFGETIHDHQKAIEQCKPPYAITMNWSSPRQVLIDAGLFDESYLRCQDVDLSQKILRRNHRIVYQHAAVIYHRNERTITGLFHEGFQHGMWAVKHNKHLHAINVHNGHRRINLQSYRKIVAGLLDILVSEQRFNAFCQFTFDIGKKCGKVAGSCRFGYLDL